MMMLHISDENVTFETVSCSVLMAFVRCAITVATHSVVIILV